MLSFRFHIVSLIAVFLALAIGIAAGSTFIDRAIVDNLQDRVDNVSSNLDARRAENQALTDQVRSMEEYVTDSAPWLVEDRLNGRSITVVAPRGVDDAPVEAQVDLLREAGADVPGVVWLEPELVLAEADDRRTVADAFELVGGGAEELEQQLWALLAAEVPDNAAAALDTLVDIGFAEIDTVGGEAVEPTDVRLTAGSVLLVSGPESELGVDAVGVIAGALADGGANVLVGEVFEAAGSGSGSEVAQRGDTLAPVLDDAELRDVVATDDALDLLRGRTAAVLALEELAVGRVSHVGFGEGASAPVPPLPGS